MSVLRVSPRFPSAVSALQGQLLSQWWGETHPWPARVHVGRRGRNRTRGGHVNSVPSVPTHKPYDTERTPRSAPAHTSSTRETATRFTARRHADSKLSEITGHTCALGSGSQIRTSVLRV